MPKGAIGPPLHLETTTAGMGGAGASFLFNCAQPSSWFVHSASATQFSSSFSDILRPDGPSCRHTRFYFSPNDVVVPLFSLIHFLSTREKIKKRKSPAYGTTPKMDADHLGGSIQAPSSFFFLIFQKVFFLLWYQRIVDRYRSPLAVAINQSTPSLSLPLVFIGDRLMAARSHKRRLVLARVPLSLYASARQLEESCRGPIWKGGLCVPVGKTRTVLYLSTAREYI